MIKTAKRMLERYTNPRDEYEQNIKEAAEWLVDKGMGDFKYSTQWMSGNSQWYSAKEERVITVKCKKNR